MSTADLIDLLEAEDGKFTFHGFRDLPAELRNRIYRFATVKDPSTALMRPTVPAICQASRQLRNESLPIFYGFTNFGLLIHSSIIERRPQHRSKVLSQAHLDRPDALWIQHLGDKAQLLRHLTINVMESMLPNPCSLTSIRFKQGRQDFECGPIGVWAIRNLMETLPQLPECNQEVLVPNGLERVLSGVCRKGMSLKAMGEIVACFCDEF